MLDASNPLVAEVKSNTEQVTTIVAELVIDSPEMYELAADQLREVKTVQKRIDETRKSMTKPLDDSKKAIMDFFRPFADAADKAEADLKRKMLGFQDEQRRAHDRLQELVDKASKELDQIGAHKEAEVLEI